MIAILLFLILPFNLFAAEDESAVTLSFGPMVIGEERIPISFEDFPVTIENTKEKKELPVKAKWIEKP